MGYHATVHRTIQNCSINFQGVCPNDSTRLVVHGVQALRQLYVLACQKRIMRAIDVNIRQPVYVPVTLAMASEHPTMQQAPLDVSRNENEPLNTPSNVPAVHDGKRAHGPLEAAQACCSCLFLLTSCCRNTFCVTMH